MSFLCSSISDQSYLDFLSNQVEICLRKEKSCRIFAKKSCKVNIFVVSFLVCDFGWKEIAVTLLCSWSFPCPDKRISCFVVLLQLASQYIVKMKIPDKIIPCTTAVLHYSSSVCDKRKKLTCWGRPEILYVLYLTVRYWLVFCMGMNYKHDLLA